MSRLAVYAPVRYNNAGQEVSSFTDLLVNVRFKGAHMTSPDDTSTLKTCTKCGQTFPATTEFFAREQHGKYGFRGDCKICNRKRVSDYGVRNSDKKAAYRAAHKEQHKAYVAANPRDRTKYLKKYRDEHREEMAAYQMAYKAAHPEFARAIDLRRRARKAALPNTLTSLDIKRANEYFGGLCAVCDKQASTLFHNAHLDHWQPLSRGGGTTPENMLPLCAHCNMSKHDHDPIEWLTRKFGKRKAKQISRRVQEFFEWVKAQS